MKISFFTALLVLFVFVTKAQDSSKPVPPKVSNQEYYYDQTFTKLEIESE